ncbi:MAG: 2-amino-4-hydroxy-6-hydroxymethyldihydropteridine diphosphokinase [Xanthomonadales bacterium]|nr:2-amino-4-hydroxy-6-hydroxymethyldihydropteridine diphosphokinase [Xanthomonadales bacterium]MBK7145662.1 2-amino-4-hydroxy-6-hydroxymethyldihydropteridine diphosphokinase [Xanthomonadales bacterium]MCC6561509.1 2-amino-4-hydroxy-6-hydroxymethyldihydropteridine diphosphokinase [Xanthomonadales bacterium]
MSSNDVARAFVALGANLDDPAARLREAMARLDEGPLGRVVAQSSLYRSAPVGRLDQPHFVNALVELRTALCPLALMRSLLQLEVLLGRVRGERNGPRRIDLDLVAFDARVLATPELQLPHPRALERAFVMLPWSDIAPDFRPFGGDEVRVLASRLLPADIHRLHA